MRGKTYSTDTQIYTDTSKCEPQFVIASELPEDPYLCANKHEMSSVFPQNGTVTAHKPQAQYNEITMACYKSSILRYNIPIM